MARPKMVTRTVGITRITAVVLNVNTLESHVQTFTVSGRYEQGTKELKTLLASKNTDDLMWIKAESVVYEEKLFGMSEEDFLAHAKELPPRKAGEADAEE